MTDAPAIPPLDNRRSDSEHEAIVTRIVRLEVTTEYTIKTLDLMQRRMDDGFKNLHDEIVRSRAEMRADLRWLIGIQITTLLAVVGMLARMANFF